MVVFMREQHHVVCYSQTDFFQLYAWGAIPESWAENNSCTYLLVRSREYRFTHKNCLIVDIPSEREAFSGEII